MYLLRLEASRFLGQGDVYLPVTPYIFVCVTSFSKLCIVGAIDAFLLRLLARSFTTWINVHLLLTKCQKYRKCLKSKKIAIRNRKLNYAVRILARTHAHL